MTKEKFVVFILCMCATAIAAAQPKTDHFLEKILQDNQNKIFQDVLKYKDSFRVQIIYTQINRDKHNKPSFTNYYFNNDTNLYFNPASTVKLPLALLAMEKFNDMSIKGVTKYTSIQIDSSYPRQVKLYEDSTSENGLPSIAHFIKKVFLISDNDAYNRLYQFIGQQTINRNLHSKGYIGTRITRQFMGFTPEENRHTNAVRFLNNKSELIYTQPQAYNTDSFYFGKPVKIGRAYYNSNDSLINEPIDFTRVNNLPLYDLQQMLQSVLFPESVPVAQRFRLSKDDYDFVYRFLSQYPSETSYPKYDSKVYYDSYVKYFFMDSTHVMPYGVRVFNKVGWAYGFLTDVSYVGDFKNNIEYMLSATVYVNSDGVLNDDKYDYESTGLPFMYQLGQTIYRYELQRQRKNAPDLKRFEVQYEKRDVNDTRPAIMSADN